MKQISDNGPDAVADVPGEVGPNAAEPPRTVDEAPLSVRVNGVPMDVAPGEPVPVSAILDKAKVMDAIAGDPGDYILQTPSGEILGRDQTIRPTPDEEFLAMPAGPTPVA